jgi:hypothetical protein
MKKPKENPPQKPTTHTHTRGQNDKVNMDIINPA